ncbi:MAG: type II toxin-antitoxin system RelE/ParE family toxin [Campylobacterota bacterium]
MQIIRDEFYLSKLDEIINYMAQSSLLSTIRFLDKLDAKIDNIPNMPFKFRQSIYYTDEKIRDLIFKGYTIPYLIDEEKKLIVVLDIFKYSYRKIVK